MATEKKYCRIHVIKSIRPGKEYVYRRDEVEKKKKIENSYSFGIRQIFGTDDTRNKKIRKITIRSSKNEQTKQTKMDDGVSF